MVEVRTLCSFPLARYYQLPPQGPPSVLGKADDAGSKTSSLPVELVTVPALGPEWRKEEIKNMTAHGRSEDVWYERRKKFTEWRRDQRAICGKWGTRKQIVIGGFIFAVMCDISTVFFHLQLVALRSDSFLSNSTASQ